LYFFFGFIEKRDCTSIGEILIVFRKLKKTDDFRHKNFFFGIKFFDPGEDNGVNFLNPLFISRQGIGGTKK